MSKKKYKFEENEKFQLKLIEKVSFNSIIKTKNDPFCHLLNAFNDYWQIVSFIKPKTNFIIFLYNNKEKVHDILYNADNYIKISDELLDSNLYNSFYLFLLIRDREEMINYILPFSYIKKLYNQMKDEKFKFKNMIIAKLILEFLNNYKNSDNEDESIDENIISELEEKINVHIKKDINIFNEIELDMNEDEFIKKNIDELYLDIIISLIKNDKLTDFDLSKEIFEQINLDVIYIPFVQKNLLDKIQDVLNTNNDYIKKYIIQNIDDLHNQKKVNFIYMILKYIFKDSFYIYNIPFLHGQRLIFLKILKSGDYKNYLTQRKEKDEKIEFISQELCDLNYITYKQSKGNNILVELNMKNKSNNLIITKVEFSVSHDKEEKIIIGMINNKRISFNYLDEQLFNGKKESKIENSKLKNISPKYFDYLNIIKETLKRAIKLFENLILKILIQEKNNKCNAFYTLINKEPGKNSISEKDYDILGKDPKELIGMNNIINKIGKNNLCDQDKNMNSTAENSTLIQSKEESLNQTTNYNNSNSNSNSISNSTTLMTSDSGNSFNSSIIKAKDQYIQNGNTTYINNESTAIHSRIIKDNQNVNSVLVKAIDEENIDYNLSNFEKVINNHYGSCKFFFQLRDNNFLSAGNDKIIIYDQKFNSKTTIENFEDILLCVAEKKSDFKNYIELIVCCLKNIYLVSINKDNNFRHTFKKYEIPNCKTLFCYNIYKNNKEDYYILAGKDFSMIILSLFNDSVEEKKMFKLLESSFNTGIKINDNNIALISNALLPGGKNQISIFNLAKHNLVHTIENISPTLTENCACVMEYKDKSNILLCGCKKSFENGENGIVIAHLYLETNQNNSINMTRLSSTFDIEQKFYYTKNFQVYCLCEIYSNEENDTELKYFLAGGFDTDKKIGMIKLFQLDKENLDIKYLQDLELDEYYEALDNLSLEINDKPEDNKNKNKEKGLNLPINNITLCKRTKKIIATSMNGGIYLFSKPNLNLYIDRNE